MSERVSDHAHIVELLGLAPHPEGGFYRETFRASHVVTGTRAPGEARPASTAIYFLLPAGTFSAFHRVASDEVWHHYDGAPLELHVIEDGAHERVVLGRDLARGERPQHVVRAGAWQAAAPIGDAWTLAGCTVSPGFDFADFEMPPQAELLALLPEHHALVRRFSR
jgi:predicted cupin superfamily sugar epimerase